MQFKIYRLLVIGTLTIGMMTAAAVEAQSKCADRDVVVARLEKKYDEGLSAGGLQFTQSNSTQNKRPFMELWASEETGTYTILLTKPTGITCIVAAGDNFFLVYPEKAPTLNVKRGNGIKRPPVGISLRGEKGDGVSQLKDFFATSPSNDEDDTYISVEVRRGVEG